VCHNGHHRLCPVGDESLSSLDQSATRIGHVVD
jgi:hypothetical protein